MHLDLLQPNAQQDSSKTYHFQKSYLTIFKGPYKHTLRRSARGGSVVDLLIWAGFDPSSVQIHFFSSQVVVRWSPVRQLRDLAMAVGKNPS